MLTDRIAAGATRVFGRAGLTIARAPAVGNIRRSHPDIDAAFAELLPGVAPYTQTTVERLYALWLGIEHVVRTKVAGDIVECGVWRGGSTMLAALALSARAATDRRLWLYDTFDGMPEPGDRDVDVAGRSMPEEWDRISSDPDNRVLARATLPDVQANLRRTGYPADEIEWIQGKVEDTIPGRAPETIALLRLDTDWYDSTRHELEHLWPRLSAGGVLIIDDYGHWQGARAAVDEYFAGRDDVPLLTRIDYTGRMAVKR